MQKQCRSGKLAGMERSNDKLIVTEVPTFCNRWPGASGTAGCIIGLIQFLSLHDHNFLKRKHFLNLNQVSWPSDNKFFMYPNPILLVYQ